MALGMTDKPRKRMNAPVADGGPFMASHGWLAPFNHLRSFATTVCRLQVDLLQAVADEHTRAERDLADWSLKMYEHIRQAVALHLAALQSLVPGASDDIGRPGSPSWIEDCAAELSRILMALTHDDTAVEALLRDMPTGARDAGPARLASWQDRGAA